MNDSATGQRLLGCGDACGRPEVNCRAPLRPQVLRLSRRDAVTFGVNFKRNVELGALARTLRKKNSVVKTILSHPYFDADYIFARGAIS